MVEGGNSENLGFKNIMIFNCRYFRVPSRCWYNGVELSNNHFVVRCDSANNRWRARVPHGFTWSYLLTCRSGGSDHGDPDSMCAYWFMRGALEEYSCPCPRRGGCSGFVGVNMKTWNSTWFYLIFTRLCFVTCFTPLSRCETVSLGAKDGRTWMLVEKWKHTNAY